MPFKPGTTFAKGLTEDYVENRAQYKADFAIHEMTV